MTFKHEQVIERLEGTTTFFRFNDIQTRTANRKMGWNMTFKHGRLITFLCSCRMPLSQIDALSDAEQNDASQPRLPDRSSPRGPGKLRQVAERVRCPFPAKQLANLIRSKCGCRKGCFANFRTGRPLQEWLSLRKLLGKMAKLDKDQYVRVLTRFPPSWYRFLTLLRSRSNLGLPASEKSGRVSERKEAHPLVGESCLQQSIYEVGRNRKAPFQHPEHGMSQGRGVVSL